MAESVEIANAYVALTARMPGVEKDVASALGGADGAFEKAGRRGGSLFGQMVGANLIANLGAKAIEGAISGIVGYVNSSIDSYKEAQAAQVQLTDAYARFPAVTSVSLESLRALNSEIMRKTQFDDDALASGQAVLAQYDLTGEQLASLTPLLADFAAKTGTDVTTAAGQLGKALLGQGRALKGVGIDFVDAGSVAANYEQIMAGLTSQVGGFAETQGQSFEGMQARLTNAFGEIQETIGGAVIPILTDLGNALLTYVVPILSNAAGVVADNMGPAFEALKGFLGNIDFSSFGQLLQYVTPLGLAFQVLGPILPQLATAFGAVAAALGGALQEALPIVAMLLSRIAGVLSGVLAAVLPTVADLFTVLAEIFSGVLAAVLPIVADVVATLGTALDQIASTVLPVLLPVITQLATVFGQVLFAVAPLVGQLVSALMPIILSLVPIVVQLAGIFASVASAILPVLVPIVGVLAQVLGSVLQAVMPVIAALVGALSPILSALAPIILSVLSAVLPLIEALVGALAPILTTVADILAAVLVPVFGVVTGVIQALAAVITWLVQNIVVPYFMNLLIPAVQNVGAIFQAVFGGLGGFFSGIWEGIVAGFRYFINTIIDGINGFIGGLNIAGDFVATVTGGAVDFTVPNIPRLAAGAFVKASPGGSIVNVGEGKYDEVVLPLSPSIVGQLAGGGGMRDGDEVSLVVDGQAFRAYVRRSSAGVIDDVISPLAGGRRI